MVRSLAGGIGLGLDPTDAVSDQQANSTTNGPRAELGFLFCIQAFANDRDQTNCCEQHCADDDGIQVRLLGGLVSSPSCEFSILGRLRRRLGIQLSLDSIQFLFSWGLLHAHRMPSEAARVPLDPKAKGRSCARHLARDKIFSVVRIC